MGNVPYEEIEKTLTELCNYVDHKPTCTMRQDWSEAEQAFADTPTPFRDHGYDEAVAEMNRKKNTCSCGLKELTDRIKKYASNAKG